MCWYWDEGRELVSETMIHAPNILQHEESHLYYYDYYDDHYYDYYDPEWFTWYIICYIYGDYIWACKVVVQRIHGYYKWEFVQVVREMPDILDFLFLIFIVAISCILGFTFYRKAPKKPWKAALLVTLLGALFTFTLNAFILVVIRPEEYFSIIFLMYISFYSIFIFCFSYHYFSEREKREEFQVEFGRDHY